MVINVTPTVMEGWGWGGGVLALSSRDAAVRLIINGGTIAADCNC